MDSFINFCLVGGKSSTGNSVSDDGDVDAEGADDSVLTDGSTGKAFGSSQYTTRILFCFKTSNIFLRFTVRSSDSRWSIRISDNGFD